MDNNLVLHDVVNENPLAIGNQSCRYNVVKIGFGGYYKYKNANKENFNKKHLKIQICIGIGIAKKLSWKNFDQINIFWFDNYLLLNKIKINKDKNSEYKNFKGYKFREIKNTYSYGIAMTCNFIIPPPERGIRTVKHEIVEQDGGKCLKVFFEGGK
jgi:hypothetical protein